MLINDINNETINNIEYIIVVTIISIILFIIFVNSIRFILLPLLSSFISICLSFLTIKLFSTYVINISIFVPLIMIHLCTECH